jgi:hypothetical protein
MARKHLVYVLPGIGGSVLERPGVGGKRPKTVWDAGVGDITGLLLRPERLGIEEPLRATGLIQSKRLFPGWTVVSGYEGLVQGITALPGVTRVDAGHPDHRDLSADVVLFPYDFRLGVAHAAQQLAADVHERLKHLSPTEREGRVVVIAHSMGGLVARYWLGPLEGWPQCRALVTLGTPHRGAPKALQMLVNGVRVAGKRMNGASDLLRQWPSVAELLPRYPAVWDATTDTACYPHELPLPGLGKAATSAFAMHQDIEQAWRQMPRTGKEPQMVPRLGWSHGTPGSAVWDGRKLTVGADLPRGLDLEGWEQDHGDGTVPAISAVPLEMSGHDPAGWRVRERHGPLVACDWVPALAQAYETRNTLLPAHGQEREAALGLDLEELHAQGDPIPLRVRLRATTTTGGELSNPTPPVVRAVLRRVEGGAPARVAEVCLDWDPDTGSFVTDLPGREPGLYDVAVKARAVPGVGDLTATDTVAVVEP